jgi:hypothetical protein
MTITIEKCGLCGEAINASDVDTVQLHAGVVGSLVHQECLREYEDDGPEADENSSRSTQ